MEILELIRRNEDGMESDLNWEKKNLNFSRSLVSQGCLIFKR